MRLKYALLAAALTLSPQFAWASTIDLTSLVGNFDQSTFGVPNSVFFGQSLIADAGLFSELRFSAAATSSSSPLLFDVLITGDRADSGGLGFAPDLADIRYTSANLSIGATTQTILFPNLAVTPGERLFVVLNAFSFPASGVGSVRATQFNAPVDPYLPGEFVFLNRTTQTTFAQVDASTWAHRSDVNEDLAIYARFDAVEASAVPEPATLSLLGLGLAGAAVVRYRRRR